MNSGGRTDSDWVEVPDDGFVGYVGPFWLKRYEGALSFRFHTGDRHRNRAGVVQGGALMTFGDRALGTVARDGSEIDLSATMHMDMHFVDSVKIGEVVETRPVLVRRTKSSVFVRGDLTVGERVVATATGIWRRFERS